MHDRRTFPALVGGGLLLVVLCPTTSSAPALPAHTPPPPGAERMAMLAELSHWSRQGDREFVLFGERALGTLEDERRRSFALFSAEDDGGRRALLATLPYGPLIADAAEAYRLDSLLLAAVVEAESGFDAAAISPQGARGLMQLMPMTAQSYGAARPADPRANVRAGARYLRDLLRRFDGDLELALAAYNAGPAAVRRFRGVPPYRETRMYVERVLTLYLGYHRTLWQEAQLAEMLGDLPTARVRRAVTERWRARVAPPVSASARIDALGVGAFGLVPAVQPLPEVADALAQPLAERRQTRVAEDQQHDGEDDQQLGDTEIEHGDLRGGGPALSTAAWHLDGIPERGRSGAATFSLTDRPAAPPTPLAAPAPAPEALAPKRTSARPAAGSAPPA
jgi:hypothetical protein